MSETDLQLLTRYATQRAEDAFAEIVRRHIDLVHSAAVRQVRSPELAEEVAQAVFIELARNARRLPPRTVLAAWLYQVTSRRAIDVVRREAGRRLREQTAQELQAMNATAEDWAHIEPLLDDAMEALEETDRIAVLLRYFQNKPLREVGQAMGVSDDAAQKRVSRAVERLRAFFAQRGVNVGASGLAVIISVNAVQAAPVSLAAALSGLAAPGGAAAACAQLTGWMGRLSLPTVTVGVLVFTLAALLALHEVRSRRASLSLSMANDATMPAPVAADGTAHASARQTAARLMSRTASPVSAVPPDTTQRDLALKLYREGEDLQRNKRFDEAIAKYDRAAAIIESGLAPERWMVDFYFTRATMDPPAKRDSAAVIEDYTKALGIHPNFSSALANRALEYSRLKQYEAANADFTRLIEDTSVDFSTYMPGRTNGIAWAHEYRGRMWLDARRATEAIPDLQNAVALYTTPYEKVHAQFYLAAAYKASQQREQVVAEANSMAEQALKWATRPGGASQEKGAAESGARWASEFMDHKASYQLEVLAAVKAKAGDFTQAVREQERALHELPATAEDQREAMQARLDLYRAGKSLASP